MKKKKKPIKKVSAVKSISKVSSVKSQTGLKKAAVIKKVQKIGPKRHKPAVSPKKELDKTRKQLRSLNNPIYNWNRKIKNAPSRYYKSKFKKEKQKYIDSVNDQILQAKNKRDDLKVKEKQYKAYQQQRKTISAKISALRRKKARTKDKEALRKLNHQELKYQIEKDNLDEAQGVELDRLEKEEYDEADWEDDGGRNFEADPNNPYNIWQAEKKLQSDLDSGEYKFFIIDGDRISSKHPEDVLLSASSFWISVKSGRDGTPLILRYTNFKTNTVKYISANF